MVEVNEWLKTGEENSVVVAKSKTSNEYWLLTYSGSGNKFYHFCRKPVYMTLNSNFVIMETVGDELDDNKYLNSLEVGYVKKYHSLNLSNNPNFIKTPLINGYVTTEGDLFLCEQGGHTWLGSRLGAKFFDTINIMTPDGIEEFLLKKGYVVIRGTMLISDKDITKEQGETLKEIQNALEKIERNAKRFQKNIDDMITNGGGVFL